VDYDENLKKMNVSLFYKTLGMNLNTFINLYNVEKPNYIKIDVDGVENLILKGSDKIFESKNLLSVLIESSNHTSEISDFLQNHGFKLKSTLRKNQIWVRS